MGASVSSVFPKSIIDCGVDTADDARYEYACTASNQIRTGLTTIHLLVILAVVTITMLLYVIYLRVLVRKFHSRLLALPGKGLPFAPSDVPRWMYKTIVATYTTAISDECVIAPPKSNLIEGAKGWGLAGTPSEGLHYREAIQGVAGDFTLLVDEALEASGVKLTNPMVPTLRSRAPQLIRHLGLSPAALWHVISTIEKAEHLNYEFTAEEFALCRQQIWGMMSTLRAAMGPPAMSAVTGVSRGDPGVRTARRASAANGVSFALPGQGVGGGEALATAAGGGGGGTGVGVGLPSGPPSPVGVRSPTAMTHRHTSAPIVTRLREDTSPGGGPDSVQLRASAPSQTMRAALAAVAAEDLNNGEGGAVDLNDIRPQVHTHTHTHDRGHSSDIDYEEEEEEATTSSLGGRVTPVTSAEMRALGQAFPIGTTPTPTPRNPARGSS